MRVRDYWRKSWTRLFRITDCPEYLFDITLDSLIWENEVERVCAHCGSIQINGKCPNCGAVAAEKIQFRTEKARARLSGLLPMAATLADARDGSRFDLVYKTCCDPTVYDEDAVILSLTNCRIIQKAIPIVQAHRHEDDGWMEFIVDMECTVDLIVRKER